MTASLTAREHGIVQATARGMTDRLIAEQFSLTLGAVKAQQKLIRRKLGVRNRVQAVVAAAQAGWLDGLSFPSDVKPITEGQMRALHAKANDLDRLGDYPSGASKQGILSEASEQFGRLIEHANELRAREASWVLDRLESELADLRADSTGITRVEALV